MRKGSRGATFLSKMLQPKTGTPDTNTVTNTDAQRQSRCNFLSEMLHRETGTPASQDTNTDTNTITDANIDANTDANKDTKIQVQINQQCTITVASQEENIAVMF